MNYYLGLDIGTSSTKAILIDKQGDIKANVTASYDFETPKPLWAETNPEHWWTATQKCIKKILSTGIKSEEIKGIGLTGQMHGLVVLNKDAEVIRPCIMWNDQRSQEECDYIYDTIGKEKYIKLSGNQILTGFTLPKILWLKNNEPENYTQIKQILLPKDYIRFKLSGTYQTDVSDASGMGILDVKNRKWSQEILDKLDISESILPSLHESIEMSSSLSKKAAQTLGLIEGTPITAGAGDQAAQAVGCGITSEGIISATFGTSGVVFAHAKNYAALEDGSLHAFCSAVPGEYHLMGVMLSAAGSFQWYKDQLGYEETQKEEKEGVNAFTSLLEEAEKIEKGAEGLYFMPYLSGERTPYADPNVRASFIGLTQKHTKAHMTRSVVEGITYGMKDLLDLVNKAGVNSKSIIASGGGSKSTFWLQLMADVFNTQIKTVNASEGAAFGAALLAVVGMKEYESIAEACQVVIKETKSVNTSPDNFFYKEKHLLYTKLYPALKAHYDSL